MILATLAGCQSEPTSGTSQAYGTYTYADTMLWDAEYDVVVAGFGAVSAKHARWCS